MDVLICIIYDFGAGGNFLAHLLTVMLGITVKEKYTDRNEYITEYNNVRTVHYHRVVAKKVPFESDVHYILINCRTAQVREYVNLLGEFKKGDVDILNYYTKEYVNQLLDDINLTSNVERKSSYCTDTHVELHKKILEKCSPIIDLDYEDIFVKRDKGHIERLLKFLGIANYNMDNILKELDEYFTKNNMLVRQHFNI